MLKKSEFNICIKSFIKCFNPKQLTVQMGNITNKFSPYNTQGNTPCQTFES